jgi:hypothetical protein
LLPDTPTIFAAWAATDSKVLIKPSASEVAATDEKLKRIRILSWGLNCTNSVFPHFV